MEELNEDTKVLLRKKQAELIKIISAFVELNKSTAWETLKELVFSKSIESIERQILVESASKEINTNKLYKLQGEYAWAAQYTNLDRFIETLKAQLENIKNQLK